MRGHQHLQSGEETNACDRLQTRGDMGSCFILTEDLGQLPLNSGDLGRQGLNHVLHPPEHRGCHLWSLQAGMELIPHPLAADQPSFSFLKPLLQGNRDRRRRRPWGWLKPLGGLR